MASNKTILVLFFLCFSSSLFGYYTHKPGAGLHSPMNHANTHSYIGQHGSLVSSWYSYGTSLPQSSGGFCDNKNIYDLIQPINNAFGQPLQNCLSPLFNNPSFIDRDYVYNNAVGAGVSPYNTHYTQYAPCYLNLDEVYSSYGQPYKLSQALYGKVDGTCGVEVVLYRLFLDVVTNAPISVDFLFHYRARNSSQTGYFIQSATGVVDYRCTTRYIDVESNVNDTNFGHYNWYFLGYESGIPPYYQSETNYYCEVIENYPLYDPNCNVPPYALEFSNLLEDKIYHDSYNEAFTGLQHDCGCDLSISLPWINNQTFDYTLPLLPTGEFSAGVNFTFFKDCGRLYLLFNICLFFMYKIITVIREY